MRTTKEGWSRRSASHPFGGPGASARRNGSALASSFVSSPGVALTDAERLAGRIAKSYSLNNLNSIAFVRGAAGGNEDVERPFEESWVVYRCVRLWQWAVAQIPLRIWETDDPEADEVTSGPLFDLLAKPNSLMSRSQLFAAGICHRKLSGEDFWFLMDDEGQPLEARGDLIPLPSQIVPVIGHAVEDKRDPTTGHVVSWRYRNSGTQQIPFDPASVVHFYDYDPGDPIRGIGDAEVALRDIGIGFQMERYLEATSRIGGPGAFISYPNEIDPNNLRRLQSEIDETMSDMDRAGGFHALSGNPKVTPNPANPHNMQALETLDKTNVWAALTLGVPPPCIGMLTDATFSNYEQAWTQFWGNVVADREDTATVINSMFLPRIADRKIQGYRVGWDYSGIAALQEDDSDRWKTASLIAQANGIPLQSVADLLKIDYDPDAFTVPEEPEQESIEVQATEPLDGQQVSSLLEVLDKVRDGTLSSDSAMAIISVAFPEIDEAEAKRIVDGVEVQEDEPVEEPVAPQDDPEDEEDAPPMPRALMRGEALTRPLDTEERDAYAKAYEQRVLSKGDQIIERRVIAWHEKYLAEQLERMDKAARRKTKRPTKAGKSDLQRLLDAVTLTQSKWERLFGKTVRAPLQGVMLAALEDVSSELDVLAIPVRDPRVVRALANQIEFVSRSVTDTLETRIRTIITEGMAEGDSTLAIAERFKAELPALKREVKQAFGNKDQWSQAIARTETNKAANTARFAQFQDAGITRHQWVTSHNAAGFPDDAVRYSHAVLDGQIRDVGEEFAPSLKYPLDPDAPASQVVRCRCVSVAIIDLDEDPQ